MTNVSIDMSHQAEVLEKLRSRQALIGIVGLGYVGLPLSLTYAEVGYRVLGLDIDQAKADAINQGQSYIEHIDDERVSKAKLERRFEATVDFSRAAEADALILCVPTPLNQYREPDLGFIRATMAALLPYLRAGQVLSLESTTYPGTTEEELLPLIEQRGFNVGKDFFLIYSPEREDPGNTHFSTSTIPKVMGGSTTSCSEVGVALYEKAISEVVSVSSPRAAEMTKLLENIHRAVNIGLMNELKPLADRMGIDLYEVIRAAATKPLVLCPITQAQGWVVTAFRSILFISPGRRGSMECTPGSLSWLARSIRRCRPTWWRKRWMLSMRLESLSRAARCWCWELLTRKMSTICVSRLLWS